MEPNWGVLGKPGIDILVRYFSPRNPNPMFSVPQHASKPPPTGPQNRCCGMLRHASTVGACPPGAPRAPPHFRRASAALRKGLFQGPGAKRMAVSVPGSPQAGPERAQTLHFMQHGMVPCHSNRHFLGQPDRDFGLWSPATTEHWDENMNATSAIVVWVADAGSGRPPPPPSKCFASLAKAFSRFVCCSHHARS